MKFTAAVLAFAGAAAAWKNGTIAYTTEVVTELTTYCPEPTTLTHGGKTYTITKATTLTITDCPCTISKPVTTSSVVVCHTCGYNATTPVKPTTTPYSTGGVKPTGTPPVTAGAAQVATLSGAALAVVLGAAALL